jgi:hypothetical protein
MAALDLISWQQTVMTFGSYELRPARHYRALFRRRALFGNSSLAVCSRVFEGPKHRAWQQGRDPANRTRCGLDARVIGRTKRRKSHAAIFVAQSPPDNRGSAVGRRSGGYGVCADEVDVFPRLYIKAAVVATFYPVAPGGPARAGLLRWLRMVAEGGSVFLN